MARRRRALVFLAVAIEYKACVIDSTRHLRGSSVALTPLVQDSNTWPLDPLRRHGQPSQRDTDGQTS